jgi:hypothetical protein
MTAAALATLVPQLSAWAAVTTHFLVCQDTTLRGHVFVPRAVLRAYWPLQGSHMLAREVFLVGGEITEATYKQLNALPETQPVEVAVVRSFTARHITKRYSSSGIRKMLGAAGYVCRFQATLTDAGVVQLSTVALGL